MTVVPGSTACRRCRARVIFVRVTSGKLLPCDELPNDEGNVAAHRDGQGNWVGWALKKDEQPAGGMRRYMPHFATCKSVVKPGDRPGGNPAPPRQPLPAVLPANVIPLNRPRRA